MQEHIDRFADWLWGVRRLSPHTVRAYTDDLRAFEQYIEDMPIETVRTAEIRSYVMMMHERGDSPRSINRRVAALRTFFGYLQREGIVRLNPTLRIKPLPVSSPLPKFIEQDRLQRMVEELTRPDQSETELRDSLVVLLLYSTGMRRAELAALTEQDVDLAQRTVTVMGKGGKARQIPLLESVAQIMERYLQIKNEKNICKNEKNCLLLTNKDRPLDTNGIYLVVREQLTRAGVSGQKSPHILRHTFASHLMQLGAGVRSIQELLGHKSLNSTQIYAQNSIEQLKQVYQSAHPRSTRKQQSDDE